MLIEAEVVAYRRNRRANRVSGTRVIFSGLYRSNDGHEVYLSQGQTFPFGRRGLPMTWSRVLSVPNPR